jgi:hypothetical protein
LNNIKGNKNIKKKIFKGILWMILIILYIPFSLSYLSNQPLFQTFSARIATMILSQTTGYKISINSISINLIDGIDAGGLSLHDHHNNIMIKIGRLETKPVFADWKIVGILLQNVKIDSLDLRLGTYKNEDTLNLTKFINSLSNGEKTPSKSTFKLKIKHIDIKNSHFEFFNRNYTYKKINTMDYKNMVFDSLNLNISHFKLYDDSLNFKINNLSVKEKSGIILKNFTTEFILSGTTIRGHKLKANLNNSFLDCDVELNYKSWKTLSYFNDSVSLYGNFRKTLIDLSDIGYFASVMSPMKDKISFSALIKGNVNNIKASGFKFNYGEKTHFEGDVTIKDVTTFNKTYYYLNIKDFTTKVCDIKKFKLPAGKNITAPKEFSCNDNISLKGIFKGNYFDFNTSLNINSKKSILYTDLRFFYKDNDTIYFTAKFKGDSINTGHYLGFEQYIGNNNFLGTASGFGDSLGNIKININLTLAKSVFLNYKYDSLFLNTTYYKDTLQGEFAVKDSNLMVTSKIKIGIGKTPLYKVDAVIKKAFLKNLKLIDNNFAFASKLKLSVKGNNFDNMSISLNAKSSILNFSGKPYKVEQFSLDKYDSANQKVITIYSDLLDLYINGNFKLQNIFNNSKQLINNYFKIIDDSNDTAINNENINLTLNIKNDKMLSEQFMYGFRVANDSKITAKIDYKNDSVDINFYSSLLKFKNIKADNTELNVNTFDNKLNIKFAADYLILKDSTESNPSKTGMENFNFNISAIQNILDFKLNWLNTDDTIHKNSGKVQGYYYKKESLNEITFDDVNIYTFDSLWTINKNNKIIIDTSGIHFNDFIINSGKSQLIIKGDIPKNNNDTLTVNFKTWNLSNFDPILKNSGFNIDGFINGSIETTKINENITVTSDVKVSKFGLNDVSFGDLRLLNTWDNVNKSIFIKSQIIKKGSVGVGEIFSLEGFYYPNRDTNSLNINTKFNRLDIAFLNPILRNLFHGIKGKAKGSFNLNGTFDNPIVEGKAKLERTSLIINYLNTKYSFTNELIFKENKISFDDIKIYDTLGNVADISGSIEHKFFKDFNYDLTINTNKLLFINTDRRMNELYYGTAIASGNIHMWGGPGVMNLNLSTKTADGTDLSIPLDYVYNVSDNNFIVFVPPPEDSLTINITTDKKLNIEEEEENSMDYNINVNANITPQAKVNIYLPSDLGKIESRGHGTIDLTANSKGEFNMIGDYIVDGGKINFNFKNLINKKFDLVPGGKISWTGDPSNAHINIKGLYKLKASLSSLGIVVDSTSDYKNKESVYCYVILKDRLLNPDLKFAIDLPEADPDIKRMVYANLDTTNPAMVNEQMISLLVFGTFSFNNASNISVAGQGYNILANQLSSMLSQLSSNVDIGMNYRQGDDISQQEFEFALSTQLFNDRLTINGNVGMSYDRSQKNASNIVGDVDISYKLTKDGRWLLKAFNHSNTNSWYYNNDYDKVSPYTQGVGIAYRKDFNNIAELFKRSKKRKKKKKQQIRL